MSSAAQDHLLGPNGTFRRSKWWPWLVAGVAGAVLFFVLTVFIPRVSILWGYSGLKTLLYEDLGIPSEALASFFALIGSFIYAVLWLPLVVRMFWVLFGRFDWRRTSWAFVWFVLIYGHAPLLRAMYGSDVCFNQRTGEAVKWFVVQPGGSIVLYDAPGFDRDVGVQRKPATPEICRILQAQKRGIRPRPILDDPRQVKFFDEVTGQPRVWYAVTPSGGIELFDAEGTHPVLGEPLRPISQPLVQQAKADADAKDDAVRRAAQLKTEQERQRAAAAERLARQEEERRMGEAKQQARIDLINLFGTDTYPAGVVLLGARPQHGDNLSSFAARQLLNSWSVNLTRKGIKADEFKPKVYAAGHFEVLFDGNAAILSEVGLTEKMRAALLANVNAACRPSTVVDVTTCTVTIAVRRLGLAGSNPIRTVVETGAGTTQNQAITRAIELLAERHTELLGDI